LFEVNEAARLVQEAAHPEANIIFGAVIDDNIGDECRVTVIAAGFDNSAPNAETAGVEPIPAAVSATASTASETETDSAAIATESEESATSASASPRRHEEHQIPATLPSERSASNADSDIGIPGFLK